MRTFKQFMLEMGKEEYNDKLGYRKVAVKPDETALQKYAREGGIVPCKDNRFYKKDGKPWCPEDEKPKS